LRVLAASGAGKRRGEAKKPRMKNQRMANPEFGDELPLSNIHHPASIPVNKP
jgi:hypothetical protein